MENTIDLSAYDLTITRILNAPRKTVFIAWTDAKELAKWWGPKGFTNPRSEWDARPGGAIRVDMQAPDGAKYPMGGTYIEIVEPSKLVLTTSALLEDGTAMLENHVTVLLEEEGSKQTKLTIHVKVTKALPIAAQPLSGMKEGFTMSIDKLEALLNSYNN